MYVSKMHCKKWGVRGVQSEVIFLYRLRKQSVWFCGVVCGFSPSDPLKVLHTLHLIENLGPQDLILNLILICFQLTFKNSAFYDWTVCRLHGKRWEKAEGKQRKTKKSSSRVSHATILAVSVKIPVFQWMRFSHVLSMWTTFFLHWTLKEK